MSLAPLITTGTSNVDPLFTEPGGFIRKLTFDPADAASGCAGGVVTGGGGGGGVSAGGVCAAAPRLVCGTGVVIPLPCAACFICAMAAGAAAVADCPGTVPTTELELTG